MEGVYGYNEGTGPENPEPDCESKLGSTDCSCGKRGVDASLSSSGWAMPGGEGLRSAFQTEGNISIPEQCFRHGLRTYAFLTYDIGSCLVLSRP